MAQAEKSSPIPSKTQDQNRNEHIALIEQGVEKWNTWRAENPQVCADLSGADLNGMDLGKADLHRSRLHRVQLRGAHLQDADLSEARINESALQGAHLQGANLTKATLRWADLSEADLSGADLSEADLFAANFYRAQLVGARLQDADLIGAHLQGAHLQGAHLQGANLTKTKLGLTVFGATRLSGATGLDQCDHWGPCTIDHQTLALSGPLAGEFLRGCGLPDELIHELAPPHVAALHTCFANYSARDEQFVRRGLFAGLQASGVRCWTSPQDLEFGEGEPRPEIDASIRRRHKQVLVVSRHSVGSEWMERIVRSTLEEERTRSCTLLFPLRLDDAIMDLKEDWAVEIRDRRPIADFRNWRSREAFAQLLAPFAKSLKAGQI